MDYGELLYKAQENERNAGKQDVRCYKSGFSPPKKLPRSVSSANVKKFLERKEIEEKQKIQEAMKKKEELLALRNQDKKAKRRVEFMLKRTKSANYSVMEDAIDNNNTADTLEGPMQCDEDDYGYVSQEASAYYAKLMSKYNSMPAEPSPFSKAKKEVKDLSAAKDRVRAALRKEEEEAELPHKRKRKHKDKDGEGGDKEDEKLGNDSKEKVPDKPPEPTKKKNNNAPPPPSFQDLLKLAEEKKKQPVDIEKLIRNVPKEPDRPMTQKEKMEYLKERERRINRERREKGLPPLPSQFEDSSKNRSDRPQKNVSSISSKAQKGDNPLSSKQAESRDRPAEPSKKSNSENIRKLSGEVYKKNESSKSATTDRAKSDKSNLKRPEEKSRSTEKRLASRENKSSSQADTSDLADIDREIELLKKKRMLLEKSKGTVVSKQGEKSNPGSSKPSIKMSSDKSRSEAVRQQKPSAVTKTKSGPTTAGRPMRPVGASNVTRPSYLPPMKSRDRPPPKLKRRIDSDSEYDSELDDFIEDGEEEEDYSSHIKEIFGYDKSRYANVDDDDECMESNFAQQMKEEFVSTKIGILEDLEDIKKEQEEKKRLKAKKMARMKGKGAGL